MSDILIEGLTANSMIGVGERLRVTPTPLIRNLLRNGFAKVVREPRPEPVVELEPAPKPKRTRKPKPKPEPEPVVEDLVVEDLPEPVEDE